MQKNRPYHFVSENIQNGCSVFVNFNTSTHLSSFAEEIV